MVCLAMFGSARSISKAATLQSSKLVKTVEDYLYVSLSHGVHLVERLRCPLLLVVVVEVAWEEDQVDCAKCPKQWPIVRASQLMSFLL